jgi:hypothetical protein
MAQREKAVDGLRSSGSTLVAWAPNKDLDAPEWIAAGHRIGAIGRCIQWVIGDWLAFGNAKFGERYTRASKITGYDTQTLMNMVYVASRFEVSRRREKLSWSHHEALASMEPGEQEVWLDQAGAHRWSVADLRMMLRQMRLDRHGEEGSKAARREPLLSPPEPGVVVCPRCRGEVPISPHLLASIRPRGAAPAG